MFDSFWSLNWVEWRQLDKARAAKYSSHWISCCILKLIFRTLSFGRFVCLDVFINLISQIKPDLKLKINLTECHSTRLLLLGNEGWSEPDRNRTLLERVLNVRLWQFLSLLSRTKRHYVAIYFLKTRIGGFIDLWMYNHHRQTTVYFPRDAVLMSVWYFSDLSVPLCPNFLLTTAFCRCVRQTLKRKTSSPQRLPSPLRPTLRPRSPQSRRPSTPGQGNVRVRVSSDAWLSESFGLK